MDYDKISEKYDLYGKNAVTDWIIGYQNVIKLLGPLKNKVILDYGCGTGKFSRFIRDRGAKVIAVDSSKKMLKLAKSYNSDNIEYRQIESAKLDFIQPCSLDAAVFNFVLCSMGSKTEIIKILKETCRVLKKGGIIIILTVNWKEFNGKEGIFFKLDSVKKLTSGQRVGGILKSEKPFRIRDYYWFKEDYVFMLKNTKFKIHSVMEPKATDSKYAWIDEKEHSPFFIISAKKLTPTQNI